MEAGAMRDISATDTRIHTRSSKNRNPLPNSEGGRALWEKPGGKQGISPRRRPAFPLPVPRVIHERSEVPSAASPRVGWKAQHHSNSGEDLMAWSQGNSHNPHRSPPFMARIDNSPLQIQPTP